MRIGIDARMLGPRNGGLGRYVEAFVHHLLLQDADNEYVLFLKKANWDAVPDASDAYRAKFSKVLADIDWYGWQEQLFFFRSIRKTGVDLMHFPHWNVPLLYRAPFVVTIHDLIMFHYPRTEASTHGPLVYWIKDRLSRLVVRHAARASRQIIVTSQWVKEDVHASLGVPREKMTVTYQASFHKPAREQRVGIQNVLTAYGITKPYILYVGVAYPHKNLEGLLAAWQVFEKKCEGKYQLVLAGPKNYFYNRLLATPAMKQHSIRYIDFVPDEQLPALYQGASLYVFPSLSEGFGLPAVEAMSYGVPVLSSNRSCLPEILKDAAVYADPTNPEQFAAAMHATLNDEQLRKMLVEKGHTLIRSYSWDALVTETLRVYQKAGA